MTINVDPGEPPVAANDNIRVEEDATLIVQAAEGVLTNDSLITVLVSSLPNGFLTFNSDSTFKSFTRQTI